MEYKRRIESYLSGLAGGEAEIETENDLLKDAGLLEKFIEASEQLSCEAPPGLAGAVMRDVRLLSRPTAPAPTPFLSRKMCAAACFCGAATIILFTFSGFDKQIFDILLSYSGKLGELLSALKIL